MKLTNQLRTDILTSVMKATEQENECADILKRTSVLARAVLLAKIPAAFLAVVKANPPEWFMWKATAYLPTDMAPGTLLPRDGYHDSGRYANFEPIPYPASGDVGISVSDREPFDPLYKEAEQLAERYDTIRRELAGFLKSCATTEKVLERMPELEPHVPTHARPYPLVASTSNLLSSLLKSGFVVQPASHV